MNQFTCYLPLKPISYNESHCVNRGKLQSTWKNNKFKSMVRKHLYESWDNLQMFAEASNKRSILKARYIFWIPRHKLITKAQNVSKTSLDVDNCVKSLQDSIFDQLEKINSDLNDAQIVRLTAEKRQSPKNEYGITIYLSETKLY